MKWKGFPGGAVVKTLPANAGDARDEGLIPELGRSPGGEYATHSSILGLGNPMDKGAWANSAHDWACSRACTYTHTHTHTHTYLKWT